MRSRPISAAAVTPEAVQRLAPRLKVDAVLTGSVAGELEARLVDRTGQVLWSERYPLKRGQLLPRDAARLAQEVIAPRPAPAPPPPEPVRPEEVTVQQLVAEAEQLKKLLDEFASGEKRSAGSEQAAPTTSA